MEIEKAQVIAPLYNKLIELEEKLKTMSESECIRSISIYDNYTVGGRSIYFSGDLEKELHQLIKSALIIKIQEVKLQISNI